MRASLLGMLLMTSPSLGLIVAGRGFSLRRHTAAATAIEPDAAGIRDEPDAAGVSMMVDEGDDLPDYTPSTQKEPDLFVPILVGASFGGYALILLYDVFFGNGLCGVTVQCSSSPWG
jgi:hypothetical protein